MPLSRRTLTAIREILVGWTLREIRDAFEGAGIEPDLSHEPDVPGERRTLVERHFSRTELSTPEDERRLLDVFEFVLSRTAPDQRLRALGSLERDGFAYRGGRVIPISSAPAMEQLRQLVDSFESTHLWEYIDRMSAAVDANPAIAIGAAKELVEATCKTILRAHGKPEDGSPDLPKLVRRTAKELNLLADQVQDAAKGAQAMRRTLSNLATLVDGIAELRNLYGSGHGRDDRWRGVTPRHARLVVGAAATLSTFLIETHVSQEPWADPTTFDGRYVTPGFGKGVSGAEINLLDLGAGSIEAFGIALWFNPAKPSAPRTGEFHSIVEANGSQLTITDGGCELSISRDGTRLEVLDNRRCGGLNVTFTGQYVRVGPPKPRDR